MQRVFLPGSLAVIDVPAVIASLEGAGFTGEYCLEYVPMDKWGADGTDIVTATVTLRDVVSAALL